ncbi:hypothetical protein ADUPG1_001505, partial [Aduncisulcus paluster]
MQICSSPKLAKMKDLEKKKIEDKDGEKDVEKEEKAGEKEEKAGEKEEKDGETDSVEAKEKKNPPTIKKEEEEEDLDDEDFSEEDIETNEKDYTPCSPPSDEVLLSSLLPPSSITSLPTKL